MGDKDREYSFTPRASKALSGPGDRLGRLSTCEHLSLLQEVASPIAPVYSKPVIGRAEAKQIVSFEGKKLKFNKKELENILNQDHVKGLPIVILSVVGAYRTGKSFLLSWLVRYFKADAMVYQYYNYNAISQLYG